MEWHRKVSIGKTWSINYSEGMAEDQKDRYIQGEESGSEINPESHGVGVRGFHGPDE